MLHLSISMQDSFTNPYIPQESEAIRHQTEELHSPLARPVKIALIITAVLTVLIGIGLFFLAPYTTRADNQAQVDLGNAIQPPDQLAKLVPVTSTLGFSLTYDNLLFSSYAETPAPAGPDGKPQGSSPYYENNDLRITRDYNLVRLRPIASPNAESAALTNPPELLVSSTISAQTLKDAATKPDYKGLSQLNLFVKLSGEQRLAARTADDGTTVTVDASAATAQTINDVQYQKVRYTTKNDNYRIANQKYDDCYYTIQNDIPYSACVTNVRPTSTDVAALNEQMLQSLAFQKIASKDTASESQEAIAQKPAASDTTEAALITKKPEYNDNVQSLKAIAKNQPSTVRIGALYCADLALKLESGSTAATLSDACVGGVSSGTFVSKDGHIVTTGHAVRFAAKDAVSGYINFARDQRDMLDRLNRVLDYLLKARIILQSDANYLKLGAQTGDQEALAKIENIGSVIPDNFVTAVKDSYSYAVQPSNKPIAVDKTTGNKPVFAYSDSVLAATFIVADYNAEKAVQEQFSSATPATDVALLKANGSFQNVSIVGGNDIKANAILTTIGFPAYTDSSLTIDKIRNIPLVTSAKVNQTYNKEGRILVQTNSPVMPGNDGAGTFDQAGRLVGLSVYGLSYCPDQQCFANGTIRSSNELLSLVEKQNIKLGEVSPATVVWQRAVDDYIKGYYAAAQTEFADAGKQYGFNQLAQPLQKLAQSKLGTTGDTSLANQAMTVLIGVVIFMAVLTVLLAIIFFLQKRRLNMLRVGHYGVAAPAVTAPQQQYGANQPQAPGYVQPSQPPAAPQYPQYSQYPQSPQIPQAAPQAPQQYPQYQQPPQPQAPPQQAPQVQPQAPQSPPEDPFYRQ